MAIRGGQRYQRSRPSCDGRCGDNSSFSSQRQDYFSQGEGVMNIAALSHYDDDETQRCIKFVNDGIKSADFGHYHKWWFYDKSFKKYSRKTVIKH